MQKPETPREFGTRLRTWRDQKGMSGLKLARLSGLDQGALNAVERGRRPPSQSILEALAATKELELTLDELKAWAALDRIGRDGFTLIARHMPDLLKAIA